MREGIRGVKKIRKAGLLAYKSKNNDCNKKYDNIYDFYLIYLSIYYEESF